VSDLTLNAIPDKDGLPTEHKPLSYSEIDTRRALDVLAHDHLFEGMRNNNDLSVGETFGSNEDIDSAAPETVWDYGGRYVVPTGAETLNIVSTSTDDDAAGTGSQTIQIIVLDANYNESTLTIVMDGTNNVTTTGTYRACNRVLVLTSGSGDTNAGEITVTQSSSGNVLRSIAAGESVSHAMVYTVPNGKNVNFKNLTYSAGKPSGGSSPRISFSLINHVALTDTSYITYKDFIDTANADRHTIEWPFTTPQVAGTTIEFVAETTVNSSVAFGRYLRISYDVDPLYPT